MITSEIKKYRCVITDKYHNVIYEIFSNKKLSKKEMIKQIRYYQYKKNSDDFDFDKKILIISDD